jgi:WD40 repeat protein
MTIYIYHVIITRFFSIQVTSWKNQEVLAFRNTGPFAIFDVSFNPYNKYEFATSGVQNITFWEVSARNLLRKQVVTIGGESLSVITCLAHISYSLGDQIESDVIAGNSQGDLLLITCGKYVVVRERAHARMINCLKIMEMLSDKILIITAGEDECIRLWDTRFTLVSEIAVRRSTGFFTEVSDTVNLSAQSIDIY